MATGVIGILVVGILYFVVKDRNRAVISMATFGWGLYLIAVVKFLPQTYFLATAILLTVPAIWFILKSKKLIHAHTIAAISISVVSLILAIMPSDERYYLFNIKYNYHIDEDYWAWDKYSWFLNLEGKNDEALRANESASSIVAKSDDKDMKEMIFLHQQKLKADEWKTYR